MSRTRLFISYSTFDREWMDRVRLHLAVLERRQLIDVWADSRIGIGGNWQREIEQALTSARLALLLLSPGFLSSAYIWSEEMPRIIAHRKAGMEVLPFVVHPCAWRLEPHLAMLQARPAGARALSGGSEHAINLDLSNLVYELAARLEVPGVRVPDGDNEHESLEDAGRKDTNQLPQQHTDLGYKGLAISGIPMPRPSRFSLAGDLEGDLNGVRVRLRILGYGDKHLDGRLIYVGRMTVTDIEGKLWIDEFGNGAIEFREIGYRTRGEITVRFDAEYRGLFLSGDLVLLSISKDRVINKCLMHPLSG